MINQEDTDLSIARKCELVGLSRSTAYYKPVECIDQDAAVRNRMDELYTRSPFYGSRQMRDALRREGFRVNRKRVQRLMRIMGLEAQCPKPNLSRPAKGHKVYPYLMKGLTVHRANQAWCTDITYIRMEKGFVYLTAIMDWYSRKVLSWELSNTLDSHFCLAALQEAMETHGVPEVMNTDQGSQYTSNEWTKALQQQEIKISMDGRGRALDNVFVERLWRSLKYEEVYRREYTDIAHLRRSLKEYFLFYNEHRPHSSHQGRTPGEVHCSAYGEKVA